MIEAARFGLLFGATSFAAWRSWRHPLLFLYFSTNLLYEIASEWPLLAGGDRSAAYLYVYTVCTSLWLLSALGVVWEATLGYTYRLRRLSFFILFTMVLTRIIEVEIHRPLRFADWTVLLESAVSYFAGFTLVCVSFFSGNKTNIYFILGMLWMCLAGFKWAWLASVPEAVWIEAGWIVPTAFCVVAFLAVGVKMRREHG